ncbi:MAG: nitrous oxide-stimulated promoter family protein [Candidatus Zixiibacteriota bacterium]
MQERYDKADEVKKIQRDVNVLVRFIGIFCAKNHSSDVRSRIQASGRVGEFLKDISIKLCPDCTKLLFHGVGKRIVCPYDPKPRCKKCPTYCFRDGYRERIKEVMRFSGVYLIKRGRLDLAMKYFF